MIVSGWTTTLRGEGPMLREALIQIVEEKCDYMRINNLGDPETQHTVKAARAALEEIVQLREEAERLRAALQDAKDLAIGDAPAHMIIDVCGRALAVGIIEHDNP
jgi:hypothetical protein